MKKGEAKKKLALLSFSSGTTGKPKVGGLRHRILRPSLFFLQAVMISHYNLVANIIQFAQYDIGKPGADVKLVRRGDVVLGGVVLRVSPIYWSLTVQHNSFTFLP